MCRGARFMKSEKFKNFIAFLADGRNITLKAPAGSVTEKTAQKYAPHWLKMQQGITGVNIVKIEGFIYI